MLSFDPVRWLAEHPPAKNAFSPKMPATVATVATLSIFPSHMKELPEREAFATPCDSCDTLARYRESVATVAECRSEREDLNESANTRINKGKFPGAGQSVATVATVATVARENPKNEKPEPAPSTPEPTRWRAKLAALNPAQPPASIAPTRWRTLLADARWLAEVHSDEAEALGWNASDLFGLEPVPGGGGLADRLNGVRAVYIFAEHATWERDGWRWGMVPLHRDLPPLWKLAGAARIRR